MLFSLALSGVLLLTVSTLPSKIDYSKSTCDKGWDLYEYSYTQSCWKFRVLEKSWMEAVADCHGAGATLLSVFNDEDQATIDKAVDDTDFWIGLSQMDSQGTWEWDQIGNSSRTLESTGFKSWAANEPDMRPEAMEKQCVYDSLNRDAPRGWTNVACHNTLPYICAKQPRYLRSDFKFDLMLIFDGSIGIPRNEYRYLVDSMRFVSYVLTIAPQDTRVILGTYAGKVLFPFGRNFNAIKNVSNFEAALNSMATFGRTAEMGNNIYDVLVNVDPSAFRLDAHPMIIIFSSMGWNETSTGISFPDPTDLARTFRRAGINIIPIGYGPKANKEQLLNVSKCAQMVKNKEEFDVILPWLISEFYKDSIYC